MSEKTPVTQTDSTETAYYRFIIAKRSFAMLRAARYRRVSTESQEDNTSLEEQLDRMNAYCKERNYLTTDDTLYTEIMTGVVWRERPKLQRMLKDAAEGKFDVVVIDHL